MIERYLWRMRASRLVGLLGLLQARGRMTAGQLAAELEVSPRTVLRDIEALGAAGIPVYAVRGSRGGFELLDGFRSDLPAAATGPARSPGPGGPSVQRARVRLSPQGRRLAALLGQPAGHQGPPQPAHGRRAGGLGRGLGADRLGRCSRCSTCSPSAPRQRSSTRRNCGPASGRRLPG